MVFQLKLEGFRYTLDLKFVLEANILVMSKKKIIISI